ncbi:MAG TPA: UDP-3-O-(3-hydroxymyristoyl)glucosamine N-acyltransferase [Gammaproteobacteria bacterium]|nr:UDP-3-O-(3-hydroxymyristoyl)glucosamine N-acyltransferase [Gammaproteobacteria bacterium]
MSKPYTLAELARIFNVACTGDGGEIITRVADLGTAEPGSLAFLNNRDYLPLLATTRASAVVLSKENAEVCPRPTLVSDNPYALYAKIALLLHPDKDLSIMPGIHSTAVVAASAIIAADAIIAPLAVIEDGVRVGPRSYIGSGTVLKRGSVIGADCKLAPNVTVCDGCRLGDRVIVHPAAVIGADGFGFAPENRQWIKIPQLGTVVVGDDVEIGAGVAIDRGALKDTIIENGVKLDNQIHVAHNVRIGAHTAIAAQAGIAGSANIGSHCAIGGAAGILGHLQIPDGTRLNAYSQVTQTIEQAGSYASSGMPLEPAAQWRRNWVRIKQLDEMAKRIRILEKKLAEFEKNRS